MTPLLEIMSLAAKEMNLSLAQIRAALSHNLSKGEAAEESVRKFFRRYLPASLGVTKGQVIDSTGQRTKQLDVIIYDLAHTPMLFASEEDGHRLVPVEGVVAVVEVKSSVGAGDAQGIVNNMLSVKQLNKAAYIPQPSLLVQPTVTMYGRTSDHFPTMYFLFAFECANLANFLLDLRAQMENLPVWERVDMACMLSKGVLINAQPSGSFSATPSAESSLKMHETENALLIFYMMISDYLLQAPARPIQVKRYIPQDLEL